MLYLRNVKMREKTMPDGTTKLLPGGWAEIFDGFLSWYTSINPQTGRATLPGFWTTANGTPMNDFGVAGPKINVREEITRRLLAEKPNEGLPEQPIDMRLPQGKITAVQIASGSNGYRGSVWMRFIKDDWSASVRFAVFEASEEQESGYHVTMPKFMMFTYRQDDGVHEDQHYIRIENATGDVLGAALVAWAKKAGVEPVPARPKRNWRVCATCKWHRVLPSLRKSSYQIRDEGEVDPRHMCSRPGSEHVIGLMSVKIANEALLRYGRRARASQTIYLTPYDEYLDLRNHLDRFPGIIGKSRVPMELQNDDIWVEGCRHHAFRNEPVVERVDIQESEMRVCFGKMELKIELPGPAERKVFVTSRSRGDK